jgi:hypothetical protein
MQKSKPVNPRAHGPPRENCAPVTIIETPRWTDPRPLDRDVDVFLGITFAQPTCDGIRCNYQLPEADQISGGGIYNILISERLRQ